jgi:hypothetical protein
MDNPEKLVTLVIYTRQRTKTNKTKDTTQKTKKTSNTSDLDNTWALLQTTGGREDPNIVFRENRTSNQEWNEYELNKTQHKKPKKMTNEPSCSWRVNSYCFLYDTHGTTHIVKSGKCLVSEWEMKTIYVN